jgi:RND family efflux transporter MFP subunit
MKLPNTPGIPAKLITLAALGAFFSITLLGCSEQTASVSPPVARVKVFEVGKKATGQSRRISGKVESPDRSTLSFGVNGQLEEIAVEVGQSVVAGELLARLDDQPLEIALQNARANVTTSRANFLDAQSNVKRFEEMASGGATTVAELDSAKVKLAQAEGDLQLAQGALSQAELDFRRTSLLAPYSGAIISIGVDDFQEVSPSTTVVVLQSDESLGVNIRVPETLIQELDYGQIVTVSFPSLEGVTLPGTVSTIGSESETGNAFPVTVLLTQANDQLRAGMTASVTLSFDSYLDDRVAYLIPISSIAVDAGMMSSSELENSDKTAHVFVLNTQTNTLELRTLEVGNLQGNEVEVFAGLEPGELIVSAGVAFAREGMSALQWTPETGAAYENTGGGN